MQYDPKKWYWLAADGRVYSGPTQSVVTTGDSGYLAFLAAGEKATPWPKDESGVQSSTALQEVLTPYGMYADLVSYAANARYLKETGGITVGSSPVATDRTSQAMLGNAYNMAVNDGTFTTKWKNPDGSFTLLNATTIKALAVAVGNHVSACFSKEADVVAAINASPPTITTQAQVDAQFATITT